MKRWCWIIIGLVVTSYVWAVDIGSDTAPSRFATQQILNDGDRIAGFAALDGGFKLSSVAVTGIFDSFFPVTGVIDLNGGTLQLNRDLVLHEVSRIEFIGDIIGNYFAFDLAASSSCIVDLDPDIANCQVSLLNTHTLSNFLVSTDWSYDDNYIATGSFSSGFGPELGVFSFTESAITFLTSINFDLGVFALRWHPSDYLLAVGLQSAFAELRIYRFNPGGPSLSLISFADLGSHCTSVAWHPSGNYLAVGTYDSTQEIIVYSVSGAGVLTFVTSLNLSPNQYVYLQTMDWDPSGTYFSVGLIASGSSPTLRVYEFDPGTPSLTLAASAITSGKLVASTSWNQTYTQYIAAGSNSGDTIEIFEFDEGVGSLTKRFGVAVPNFMYSCDWVPDGECLSTGKNPSTGEDLRVYAFNPVAVTLSQVSAFESTSSVYDTRWSHNGEYLAASGNGALLSVYQHPGGRDNIFSNLFLSLSSDVSLKNTSIVFSGNSTINGRGNSFIIEPTAQIQVASNSSLVFTDVTIQGAQGTNIALLDSTSTISFDKVTWIQDADVTFSTGHFDVISEFKMKGNGYQFNYQTDQVSTIQADSKIILDKGFTFNYDPSIDSNSLLQLTDNSSTLVMNGATLLVSNAGLQLIKGQLFVDDISCITSSGMIAADGIIFGDGISAANNLIVHFLADSGIELTTGFLEFQNLNC